MNYEDQMEEEILPGKKDAQSVADVYRYGETTGLSQDPRPQQHKKHKNTKKEKRNPNDPTSSDLVRLIKNNPSILEVTTTATPSPYTFSPLAKALPPRCLR
jgi:beta-glucosidase-like glycosyl hydrolase